MAEPQPPNAKAGSSAAEEQENPTLKPASKDDAKAAAALSSLDARGDDDAETTSKPGDSAALAGAMKDLKVDGSSESKAKAPPKKVKIDPKDVALVVDQLDMNKNKATEFLKAHDGDIIKAFSAYVEGKA